MNSKKVELNHEEEAAVFRLFVKLDAARQFQQRIRYSQSQTLEEREEYVRQLLPLIRTGTEARSLSLEQSVYLRNNLIELVHESRLEEGLYQDKLEPIDERIREVEKKHGLELGEYWLINEGPQEWRELNDEYNKTNNSYRLPIYREFGEEELATLLETDPEQFEALCEAGRKEIFELTSPIDNLNSLINIYKRESHLCAEAGAYYAACATLGAALEALLLTLCHQYPQQSKDACQRLPKKHRPNKSDPDGWGLSDLVNIASDAGWIPAFIVNSEKFDIAEWVHLIRGLRNLIHPGNHLRNKPRARIGEQDYEDARAAYTLVEMRFEQLESALKQEGE